MNSSISQVLFTLKIGTYYSNILQEEISSDIEPPLCSSYQVPNKGDIIKITKKFEDVEGLKIVEYTLEVHTKHFIIKDFGEATITVYANVINEELVEIDDEAKIIFD